MTRPTSSVPGAGPSRSPQELLTRLAGEGDPDRITHVRRRPARPGSTAPLPGWVHPALVGALAGEGVDRLWTHQLEAAEAARGGEHVVLSTGTASGKSLGYLLPALTEVLDGTTAPTGRGATALYLAPTKALAHDQLSRIERWALPGLRAVAVDGDTPPEERRWVRDHGAYVLTNPDLLHHTLLPGHEHWASFLRALRYVVVDECHVYRGVFGAHLAHVLRRLRRVAARYRSSPTFVLASATVAEPGRHAGRLVGSAVREVTADGSPRGAATYALWEPGGGRSAVAEAADLLAGLVGEGVQTVAFARSLGGVEALATAARDRLRTADRDGSPLTDRVAAYRGGYLPEERREIEQDLRSGRLRGLAATTALELGVDVSGLDAVVLAGWPGTRTSFWQQTGRAGRGGEESLAVLVAGDDPLDAYLVHHPEAVLDAPVEAAVVDPDNPFVLGPHLAAAARELPVTEADESWFGPATPRVLDDLVADGTLRRRPTGWYPPQVGPDGAAVSLRGTGSPVRIVEARSGRVMGTVDPVRALTLVHTGAVYQHRGRTYVVTALDLDDLVALVVPGDPGWTTRARVASAVELGDRQDRRERGPVTWGAGPVEVRTRVTSFVRVLSTGEVLGEHPLDLPERRLPTTAVWWSCDEAELDRRGVAAARLPGTVHAAEHLATALLPLVATCDRWDVGATSAARHPDTGRPTVLVHDAQPGGAGFARRGFEAGPAWLGAARDVVARCLCEQGCPSCVQSPSCAGGNDPLDRHGAQVLLEVTVRALGDPAPLPRRDVDRV
ncbi:DEAD/DEAH box helicase [Lapillicoccus jejuensis]|nr:DEAD/DEAH box helicase [Lapillicoccus jejuensis]